jgi:hypothetical protein
MSYENKEPNSDIYDYKFYNKPKKIILSAGKD